MRVVVLSKERTDYARDVETFMGDFSRITGRQLTHLDPESPEGVATCEAYGILQFPTLLALSDDGHMLQMWQGMPLPTINEVSYYS